MQVVCTDFYGKTHIINDAELIDRLSAYGIYISEGRILLVQDARSMRWELPGGGIESGETIAQGLIREFVEEAGIEPTGEFELISEWQEYFYDVVSDQAWRSTRKFYRVSQIKNGKTLLKHGNGEDSLRAEFVAFKELHTIHIADSIRRLLNSLINLKNTTIKFKRSVLIASDDL